LEPDYREYIVNMVGVFREVRRVLRADGVAFVNMGDSYAGGGPAKNGGVSNRDGLGRVTGLKAKDLCGIPWRLAFALQEDGWWLRQDIIWSKPNPMPESVTDRCTKAHEYVFLLSKSERYYFDSEAVKEPMAECSIAQINQPTFHAQKGGPKDYGPDSNRSARKALENLAANSNGTRNRRSVWEIPEDEYRQFLQWKAQQRVASDVWEIATAPFPEAHFATYPPALVEPCILAGCPERCCAQCGAPWVRVTDGATYYDGTMIGSDPQRKYGHREYGRGPKNNLGASIRKTLGFFPSCSCNAGTVPGTVLDPFFGAGTTGLVADRLGRNCIGIELNHEYAAMAEQRIKEDAPLLTEVAVDLFVHKQEK
jgi:DNA modification methylase